MVNIRTILYGSILTLLLVIPALAQDVTPLPPVDIGTATGLPQSVSERGFPQVGYADAPVQLTVYCGYDDVECSRFQAFVFPELLARIEAGEVLYTAALIDGMGSIPNGREFARAAVCAAEQGGFWQANAEIYARQPSGSIAFASERVGELVEVIGIERAAWDDCMASTRPDVVLDVAQASASAQPGFEGATLPFVVVNGVASLADLASITSSIDVELAAFALTAEPDPDATEVLTVEPLLGQQIAPPLDITLPTGWMSGYDALLLTDVDSTIRSIPLAVYTGPVTGGQGTIVLLWGFPNLVSGNPFLQDAAEPDLWSDGLRLLRLAIIEQGCNIGTDLRTEYTIGGVTATGTQFSAVDCPALPNTRGWFAGVSERGLNFVFFVFTEPIDAMNTAQGELQAVLDTVVFRVPDMPEATPTVQP